MNYEEQKRYIRERILKWLHNNKTQKRSQLIILDLEGIIEADKDYKESLLYSTQNYSEVKT